MFVDYKRSTDAYFMLDKFSQGNKLPAGKVDSIIRIPTPEL